jgi:hypothetical protein
MTVSLDRSIVTTPDRSTAALVGAGSTAPGATGLELGHP